MEHLHTWHHYYVAFYKIELLPCKQHCWHYSVYLPTTSKFAANAHHLQKHLEICCLAVSSLLAKVDHCVLQTQGSEIEHVVKSVMRKQVLAGQQALSDLAPPAISGLAGPSP